MFTFINLLFACVFSLRYVYVAKDRGVCVCGWVLFLWDEKGCVHMLVWRVLKDRCVRTLMPTYGLCALSWVHQCSL